MYYLTVKLFFKRLRRYNPTVNFKRWFLQFCKGYFLYKAYSNKGIVGDKKSCQLGLVH